jgi:chromosome segregation ATPase
MKNYLSTFLALACVVLVVSVVMIKRNDSAQHDNDAATIADFSNKLDSAQTDIAIGGGKILTLSNRLDESQSAALMFSNRATAAESEIILASEQITNLNKQIAELEPQIPALNQRITDLTNQMAGLVGQIAVVETNLTQANRENDLLGNRLRRVVERKFNNLAELQTQMEKLKKSGPADLISAESIYAGLDVEIKSNGVVHVISPE